LIKKNPIDIFEGVSDEVALDVAKFLNFNGALTSAVSIILFYNFTGLKITITNLI